MVNQHLMLQLVPRSPAFRAREVTPLRQPYQRAGEQAVADLLRAFELLNRRGTGVSAWAAPFRDDPLAFLLDSTSDAMSVWGGGGELLYQNRAAAGLNVGHREAAPLEEFSSRGRRFERRCLRCGFQGAEYVLEIIREVEAPVTEPRR
jgi:hypothetical protein